MVGLLCKCLEKGPILKLLTKNNTEIYPVQENQQGNILAEVVEGRVLDEVNVLRNNLGKTNSSNNSQFHMNRNVNLSPQGMVKKHVQRNLEKQIDEENNLEVPEAFSNDLSKIQFELNESSNSPK